MIPNEMKLFRMRILSFLVVAAGLAGCVTEDPPADAEAPSGCYADAQPARDGAVRDCYVPEPDAAVSPFGRGVALYLVDTENTRVDQLVSSPGQSGSIGAWVGGYGSDGSGCPSQFSTSVVPDETTANLHNLRVWFEYDPNRSCGGSLGTARVTVDLPPLPAGDHVLRLMNGGCLDLNCQEYDSESLYLDVPVTVVP